MSNFCDRFVALGFVGGRWSSEKIHVFDGKFQKICRNFPGMGMPQVFAYTKTGEWRILEMKSRSNQTIRHMRIKRSLHSWCGAVQGKVLRDVKQTSRSDLIKVIY